MNATLYTYRNIKYTYADLQAAYRRRQEETHEAIDSGNYQLAIEINCKDVRKYLPQMAAPERSGTTGHNRTLTARKKCGIIKSIKRCIRRVKRNQEVKKMKNNFTLANGETIEIISLGRDDGAEIIGRDSGGEIVCYIATENTTQDRAAIVQAIKDGAQTLEQVFDMWENGLGGNPFDMDYLPEYYK